MNNFTPDVTQEADERSWNNRFSAYNKPLVDGADDLGVAGEKAFCEAMGLNYANMRPGGRTDGYQFVIGGKKIKVYTASKPGYSLLVKENKVTADLYVLCYHHQGNTWIAGWCDRDTVLKAPVEVPKRNGPYQIPAHKVQAIRMHSDPALLAYELGLGIEQETA